MRKNEHEKIIRDHLKMACRGKKMYLRLMSKFSDSNMKKVSDKYSAILLFPSHDQDINIYGLTYLNEYLFRENKKQFAIITNDVILYQNAKEYYVDNSNIFLIRDEQMQDILMFYRLYVFDARIKILSLEEPLGRRGTKLLGVKGLTKEMLVAFGIYHLYPFELEKIEQ